MEKKPDILNIDGTKYRTRLTRKYLNRKKWEEPDDRKIIAFIPGTVNQIFVQENQEVKEGEDIMILEAMKMLNKVKAPFDGVIRRINVTEGMIVAKGVVLLEIE